MGQTFFNNPSLTVAFAMAAGIIAQSAAHHMRIPGIVVLLVTGVVLGPDVAGIIQPSSLGPALRLLTGFAVAIILFEGGMGLKLQRLRREQQSIQQLITIGGAITVAGGTLAAKYILEWNWQTSILFGTLVMVTGPTVINPLLRRLKVKRTVATVLEAEGVLIDAIGAVVAIVAMEAALSPVGDHPTGWLLHIVSRLGAGLFIGLAFGYILASLLRIRNLIPEGIENVFTLCLVLAVFQGANALMPESGIVAVTVAGIFIGNSPTYAQQELAEFKEALTFMMIGMLFVLLAADVRLSEIRALGVPGILTVLALMLVVRPLNVFVGTINAGLSLKERFFIAWIGPRGIVAAAVASLFAAEFSRFGLSGGNELRAMVFLVITVTVLSAGLTGGLAARWLGLKKPSNFGWVILGANELARAIARLFKEDGQEVVCIDANPDISKAAEKDCTRVIFGNGLQTTPLLRAEIDTRKGAMAVTSNEEVNFLFIQKAKKEARHIMLFTALKTNSETISQPMVEEAGAQTAFGRRVDVELWSVRIRRGQVLLQQWEYAALPAEDKAADASNPFVVDTITVAILIRRNERLEPVGHGTACKAGDRGFFLVYEPEQKSVQDMLSEKGWRPIDLGEDRDFTTSQCLLDPEDPNN
jgi:NhaP-type Na+/H+ or K+/H+ antiporter